MTFIALKEGLNKESNPKLEKKTIYFQSLISELEKREIPQVTVDFINKKLEEINKHDLDSKKLLHLMRKAQIKIFQHLEKELKLVRKGHYAMMWLPLGLGVFGVPLGIAFGLAVDNLGLLGIGLPIGMCIGIGLGAVMDSKASKNGNQLNLAIEN